MKYLFTAFITLLPSLAMAQTGGPLRYSPATALAATSTTTVACLQTAVAGTDVVAGTGCGIGNKMKVSSGTVMVDGTSARLAIRSAATGVAGFTPASLGLDISAAPSSALTNANAVLVLGENVGSASNVIGIAAGYVNGDRKSVV